MPIAKSLFMDAPSTPRTNGDFAKTETSSESKRSGGWNGATGDFRRVWQCCNVYGPVQEKRLIIRRRRTLARLRLRQFARCAAAGATPGNVTMPRAMMMAAARDDIRRGFGSRIDPRSGVDLRPRAKRGRELLDRISGRRNRHLRTRIVEPRGHLRHGQQHRGRRAVLRPYLRSWKGRRSE